MLNVETGTRLDADVPCFRERQLSVLLRNAHVQHGTQEALVGGTPHAPPLVRAALALHVGAAASVVVLTPQFCRVFRMHWLVTGCPLPLVRATVVAQPSHPSLDALVPPLATPQRGAALGSIAELSGIRLSSCVWICTTIVLL